MTFHIDVAADQQTAWALLSDIERHGEWSPQEFEATKDIDGPVGIGTRYRTAGRKGARKGHLRATVVTVVEHEPPTRFAFDAVEDAGTYRTTFVITPLGTGSRVERIIDPPMTGLVPFIRHGLLGPVVRRYNQQNMDALKSLLDT